MPAVSEYNPATFGVPEIMPEFGSRVSPGGRPLALVALYAAGKIVLVMVKLNGTPTVPIAELGLLISDEAALVIAILLYVPVDAFVGLSSCGVTSRPT
jgi:hypothetical protein